MTYDNVKCHKKTGFHCLFRRLEKPQNKNLFRKTPGGSQVDSPSRFSVESFLFSF